MPASSGSRIANAFTGNIDEARKLVTTLRELAPWLRVTDFRRLFTLRRPEDFERFNEGMRLAGLPE